MKNLNISFIVISFFFLSATQVFSITFNDPNFEQALLNHNTIDIDGNGIITKAEAAAYSYDINISNLNISDVSELMYFTNLRVLVCNGNQLTNLDLSSCPNLLTLYCEYNQLTSLNLTGCTQLVNLYCRGNQLTSLDVSNFTDLKTVWAYDNQFNTFNANGCTSLEVLYIYDNQLTSLGLTDCSNLWDLSVFNNQLTTLNLSDCASLIDLLAENNQLTSLSLGHCSNLLTLRCHTNNLSTLKVRNGNNSNMLLFMAQNNPNLTCIQVDNPTYSANNWTFVDNPSYYSMGCSSGSTPIGPIMMKVATNKNKEANNSATRILTGLEEMSDNLSTIKAFPNPTTENVSIDLGEIYKNISIEVNNVLGQNVTTKTYKTKQYLQLKLEGLSGLYWVHIKTEKGEKTLKIIKE